jgi:hypothetical protein
MVPPSHQEAAVRRAVATASLTVAVLVLTAVPGLAAEGGSTWLPGTDKAEGRAEVVEGAFEGILMAGIFGVIFGILVTIYAYRLARFGEEDAHHEHAHDVRDGFGDHDPGIEEMGTGPEHTGAI